MYVLNGYTTERAELSTSIYQLDLKSHRWSTFYRQ